MFFKTRNAGFTLMELLVVIAIIGILASVVLASLNSARDKARQNAKKAQLEQVFKALVLYHADTGTVPAHLTSGHWDTFGSNGDATLQELVTGGYISHIPESPDERPYYYYDYGTFVIVATRLVPMEYGPFGDGYRCSDDPPSMSSGANGVGDNIFCYGFYY